MIERLGHPIVLAMTATVGAAEQGVDALFYHAGLKAKERDAIQEEFMSGNAEVIVATNAFGMGVDKADIRIVYHLNIPGSLDEYYQEIGRGRFRPVQSRSLPVSISRRPPVAAAKSCSAISGTSIRALR